MPVGRILSDMNRNTESSAARGGVLQTLAGWITVSIAGLKALAPYAAIELLLPGGSLMALGLWFFQRRLNKKGAASNRGIA
jgi:hypothetical protein